MRDYVKQIARFFGGDRLLAIWLLTDLEYAALGREATDRYYAEVHRLPIVGIFTCPNSGEAWKAVP